MVQLIATKKYLLVCLLFSTGFCAAQSNIAMEHASIAAMEKITHERMALSLAAGTSLASKNFDVHFYHCQWTVDPAVRYIQGSVSAHFTITSPTNSITLDLSKALTVDSIRFRGTNIPFNHTANNALEIQLLVTLTSGEKDAVSIFYQGEPVNDGSGSFVASTHAGTPVIWTFSEPYTSKDWWPCKNGLDDKADSIDIIITTPAAYTASTNGLLVQETVIGPNKTFHYQHRYPIASYLVAFAVTNYSKHEDTIKAGGHTYPFISYAYPESAGWFFPGEYPTKTAFRVYDKKFGPYPFAKERYGNTQWGVRAGMEHQTNSFVYNTTISLLGHELAHQWFGNKITCGSWSDIWLNEGLTTYSTVVWVEKEYPSYYVSDLAYYRRIILADSSGSVYVYDTSNASRIFDYRLTYIKGCYVSHMLRWVLGDSAFFTGLQTYLNDPLLAYGFARTADLQRNLEKVSGKNLNSFFKNWIYGEGYPNYSARWVQQPDKKIQLTLSQSTSHPSVAFYDMPVPIQVKKGYRDTTFVVQHTSNGQTFTLSPAFKADTVIIDPAYWILSKLKEARGNTIYANYTAVWSQNNNNWAKLTLQQTTSDSSKPFYAMPVKLLFKNATRDTAIVVDQQFSGQQYWLNIGFAADTVIIDPDSSILTLSKRTTRLLETLQPDAIKVFPNPAPQQVNILVQNPSSKQLQIQLFNTAGQLVLQQQHATPGRDELIVLPTAALPPGVYWLHIRNGSSIQLVKKLLR